MADMQLTKQEVREKDAFLQTSDKIGSWMTKHRSAVVGAGLVLVLGGIVYGAYDFYASSRESKAQEALYTARKLFNPAISNPFQQEKAPEPKLSDESAKAFESVIQNYSGTQASKVAAIELSQAFLDEKKADGALKVFDNAKASGSDIVSSLFYLQNAKVLEANGKCGDALPLLEKVWNSKSALKALQTEARLRAGICHEQLGQLDKAKEMFKLAGQEKGAAADTAKKYLRLIEPNAG